MLEQIVFEVRPFLVALPKFADSCTKPNWRVSTEIHQNMNDLVFRDKVEKSTSVKLFFDLQLPSTDKVVFMASNFSMIPIRWLLTVDSKMAFFPFPFAH